MQDNINESVAAWKATTGAFNAIMQAVTSIGDSKNKKRSDRTTGSKLRDTSIMKASKDLVLSFPVICSNSISKDTALVIQKSIERNCVTQLQMLFAAASLQGNDGVEVIKQWHNNIDSNVSMDDYFDYIESIGNGVEKGVTNTLVSFLAAADIRSNKEADKYAYEMIEECKRNNTYYPENNFSENSISEYYVSESNYNGKFEVRHILEGKYDEERAYYNAKAKAEKAESEKLDKQAKVNQGNENIARLNATEASKRAEEAKYNAQSAKELNRAQAENNRREKEKEEFKLKNDEFEHRKENDAIKNSNSHLQGQTDLFTKQLLDTDIKKCNEMVPSMMIVRYINKSASTDNYATEKEFIAGVKARLIGCDSAEIIDRVRLAIENKVTVKNFIRATTGEIRFWKDFIAGIEYAKIEAKRNSKLSKTSPIWRSLQNRSTKSTIKRLKKDKANSAGAITTLVITADECNYLHSLYKIDMSKASTCMSLMELYNFMGIVIVNEELELANFIFDGDNQFTQYSFLALTKDNDLSAKQAIDFVSKLNRG